jgi:hypothetical protein
VSKGETMTIEEYEQLPPEEKEHFCDARKMLREE